ncbi:collagen alpha-1(III) chain-like [Zalophus californianus]|uniref:Collagen alpha-1(III) chain-like n=1 Tax=Zalophus californianus TaxID=9704 RepID=A0A6P9F481_ZALCA|nr:collagen alpha-1(III) chain-like [Zalophus californianus]
MATPDRRGVSRGRGRGRSPGEGEEEHGPALSGGGPALLLSRGPELGSQWLALTLETGAPGRGRGLRGDAGALPEGRDGRGGRKKEAGGRSKSLKEPRARVPGRGGADPRGVSRVSTPRSPRSVGSPGPATATGGPGRPGWEPVRASPAGAGDPASTRRPALPAAQRGRGGGGRGVPPGPGPARRSGLGDVKRGGLRGGPQPLPARGALAVPDPPSDARGCVRAAPGGGQLGSPRRAGGHASGRWRGACQASSFPRTPLAPARCAVQARLASPGPRSRSLLVQPGPPARAVQPPVRTHGSWATPPGEAGPGGDPLTSLACCT